MLKDKSLVLKLVCLFVCLLCIQCVCVCACICLGIYTMECGGNQRIISGIIPYHSPCLRRTSLLFSSTDAGPQASGDSPDSASQLPVGVLGLQVLVLCPIFMWELGIRTQIFTLARKHHFSLALDTDFQS